jgi:hypothetical protein
MEKKKDILPHYSPKVGFLCLLIILYLNLIKLQLLLMEDVMFIMLSIKHIPIKPLALDLYHQLKFHAQMIKIKFI